MTGHDTPTGRPLDPIDEQVHRRLGDAFRRARANTPRPERHTFLARAQVRRDRLRRRRRTWTVTVTIAAAVLVLVAVGVITTLGNDTSMNTADRTGPEVTGADSEQTAITCPPAPGDPNTEPGDAMFDFSPNRLILCTYGVDGRLVARNGVPGPDEAGVAETVAYLQRAYVDRPTGIDEPRCAADEIAVNRIAVVAFDHSRMETAWIAMSGCSTPEDPAVEQDDPPESSSATGGIEPDDDSQPPTAPDTPGTDVSAFCDEVRDLSGEVPESYVGSAEHIVDLQRLRDLAPEKLHNDLDALIGWFDNGVDPDDPESNLIENFPDEILDATARVDEFTRETCDASLFPPSS